MSRIDKRENILLARLRWLREREDVLVTSQSHSGLLSVREEIRSVNDELKALRKRRSRFLYTVKSGNDA